MSWDDKPMPWWQIMRRGDFHFSGPNDCTLGVHRVFYDGWHLAINLRVCSFEWNHAW